MNMFILCTSQFSSSSIHYLWVVYIFNHCVDTFNTSIMINLCDGTKQLSYTCMYSTRSIRMLFIHDKVISYASFFNDVQGVFRKY